MSVRKAVIPVAGHGTRMLPATKAIPKELLPVVDRPLIHYVVDEAKAAGIEHIVFVTGRGKAAIEDYFDYHVEIDTALEEKNKKAILSEVMTSVQKPGATSFTRQQRPLGLGHAIWCARDIVGDEPFAILLPDVIVRSKRSCLAQVMEHYEDGANLLSVAPVPEDETHKYGIITPKNGTDTNPIAITGMVEKPPRGEAPSNLHVHGRYVLQPEIFDILARTGEGAGGEIQLTDAMAELMTRQPFSAVQFEGESHDCGSKIGFIKANLAFGLDSDEFGAELHAYLNSICD